MPAPKTRSRSILVPMAAVALLLLLAGPAAVLGKGDLQARLDAPIARDTPAGTVLLVGLDVTVPDGAGGHPVEGTPVYLRLIAPGGPASDADPSWNVGRETAPGHYLVQVTVPAGGVATIEVGIAGTSDLPITVAGDTVVPGGISPLTAQAAASQGEAATVTGPSGDVGAGAPWPAGATPAIVLLLGGLGLALALVGLGAGRRPRSIRRPGSPGVAGDAASSAAEQPHRA